ncbi:hypothetical protein [Paraburkholderia hospita]|uniref:hypothetical protein n=1 Tax=Paraburkholderia hospita TaxID=169430 RepID=UPI0010408534|nr:hypothetical protein [Paraburkholderia hospita]
MLIDSRSAIVGHPSSATLTVMFYDACENMQLGDALKPHDRLLYTRSPAMLRPLGRRPVELQHLCCQICSTNWLLELDPLRAEQAEWVCLYQATSILDPVSIFHQRGLSSGLATKADSSGTMSDRSAEKLAHRFT